MSQNPIERRRHGQPRPGQKFLRVGQVAARYDTTASTIWRWSREERYAHLGFPRAVPIGPNVSAWEVSELDEYDVRRKALREAGVAAE